MKNAGFTLMEILVALAIAVTLTGVVGLALLPKLPRSKVDAARLQLAGFRTALELYQSDNGVLPTPQQGLAALVRAPATPPVPARYPEGGYLDKLDVPADPWGREYAYLVPGPGGKPFDVVCYGADGEEGGEGAAADLSCWR